MDYGKIAYIKTQDLSRRLNNVTLASRITNADTVLILKKNNLTLNAAYNSLTFEFVEKGSGDLALEFTASLFSDNSQTAPITLAVNGVPCDNSSITMSSPTYYVATVSCGSVVKNLTGKITVTVQFALTSPAQVINSRLTVRGNKLSRYAEPPILSHSQSGANVRYLTIIDNNMTVYNGQKQTLNSYDVTKYNIKKAQISYYLGAVYLLFVDKNATLKCCLLSQLSTANCLTLAENVSAFFFLADNATVYAVKSNRLYAFTVDVSSGVSQPSQQLNLTNLVKIVNVFACKTGNITYLAVECNGGSYLFNSGDVGYSLIAYVNYVNLCGVFADNNFCYATGKSGSLYTGFAVDLTNSTSVTTTALAHADVAIRTGLTHALLQDGNLTINN